jgi:1,6-anhydro-N-acetylmuramate kinase
MTRTLYVYREDGGAWAVRKEGRTAKTFRTQAEAMAKAIQTGRNSSPAQVVVIGSNGQLLAHKSYGLPKIQDPLKRGRLTARKIAKAVGIVTLNRLKASGE